MKRRRDLGPTLFDQPVPRPIRAPRRRPMADTSLAAHDALGALSATIEDRILAAIRDAGLWGLTRKELSRRLNVEINVVCGRVNRLIHERKVAFEPPRSAILPVDPAERKRMSKDLFVQRNKSKIVVAWEYLEDWPDAKAFYTRAA